MFFEIASENITTRSSSKSLVDLLGIYQELAGNGLPHYADFNPTLLPAFSDYMAVSALQANGEFHYTYCGASLATLLNADLIGKDTSWFPEPLRHFLETSHQRAITEQRPLFTLHRSSRSDDVYLWERLILPVRLCDTGLGVVTYNTPRSFQAALVQTLFEASDDGIIGAAALRNDSGQLHDVHVQTLNLRASAILEVAISDLENHGLIAAVPSLRDNGAWVSMSQAVEQRETRRCEIRFDQSSSVRWVRITTVPLGDGAALTLSDITESKQALIDLDRQRSELTYANQVLAAQAEELSEIAFETELARAKLSEEVARREQLEGELKRLARHDLLTGAMNRLGFEEIARQHFAAAERYHCGVSIIVVDADHFKSINDTFGHAGGDEALKHLSMILAHGVRSDIDCVGRLGGEEFAILLPQTSLEGAVRLAERLRALLAAMPVKLATTDQVITASFGVASFMPGDRSYEVLLQRADEALYRAKNAGRNRVMSQDDYADQQTAR